MVPFFFLFKKKAWSTWPEPVFLWDGLWAPSTSDSDDFFGSRLPQGSPTSWFYGRHTMTVNTTVSKAHGFRGSAVRPQGKEEGSLCDAFTTIPTPTREERSRSCARRSRLSSCNRWCVTINSFPTSQSALPVERTSLYSKSVRVGDHSVRFGDLSSRRVYIHIIFIIYLCIYVYIISWPWNRVTHACRRWSPSDALRTEVVCSSYSSLQGDRTRADIT